MRIRISSSLGFRIQGLGFRLDANLNPMREVGDPIVRVGGPRIMIVTFFCLQLQRACVRRCHLLT
jgi:hypothetical protein